MKHYHVLFGLRGLYMPDSNEVHMSRRSAERSAAEHARNARDDGDKVQGSARKGYYTVGENHCIEITECVEADCLKDEV